MGTQEETPPTVEPTTEQQPAEQPAPEQQAGEDGKLNNPEGFTKALAVEREARKAAEARLKELEAAEEERRKAALSDTERAIEEAKEATRKEVEAKYARDLIQAKAAAKAVDFHDPALAVQLAGIAEDATDADIETALATLAQERPYLLKAALPPSLPLGPRGSDGSGGPIGNGDDWLRRQVLQRTT